MRMNAITTPQRGGILGAVVGGIATYAIHVFSRQGTEEDRKMGALNRNIVRRVMQLPKMLHVRTDTIMTVLGLVPHRLASERQAVKVLMATAIGPKHTIAYKDNRTLNSTHQWNSWQRRAYTSRIHKSATEHLQKRGGKMTKGRIKTAINQATNKQWKKTVMELYDGNSDYT
jgi:hypothetical protein